MPRYRVLLLYFQKVQYLTRTQPGWGPHKDIELSEVLKPIRNDHNAI